MRKFLAGNSNCAVALAVVLLAALTVSSSPNVGLSDAPGSDPSAAAAPPTMAHGSNELVSYQPNPSPSSEPTSEAASNAPSSLGYAMRSSPDVELLDASGSNP